MPGAAKVALVLATNAALLDGAAVLAALAGVGANMARGECLHCGRIAEPNFLATLAILALVAAPSLYFLYRNRPNLALAAGSAPLALEGFALLLMRHAFDGLLW